MNWYKKNLIKLKKINSICKYKIPQQELLKYNSKKLIPQMNLSFILGMPVLFQIIIDSVITLTAISFGWFIFNLSIFTINKILIHLNTNTLTKSFQFNAVYNDLDIFLTFTVVLTILSVINNQKIIKKYNIPKWKEL